MVSTRSSRPAASPSSLSRPNPSNDGGPETPEDLVTLVLTSNPVCELAPSGIKMTTNSVRELTAPRSVLAAHMPLFATQSRVELSIAPPATQQDEAMMLQFLCHGNYGDGEYPVIGPDEVATMSDADLRNELAGPVWLDLDEVWDPPLLQPNDHYWGVIAQFELEEKIDEMDKNYEDEFNSDNDSSEGEDDIGMDEDTSISDSETIPRDSPSDEQYGMATDYPPSLKISLRMYKLAASLGLPRLQLLARRRLYKSAVRHILHPDFMIVADAIFAAPPTPSADGTSQDIFEPLRDSVCTLAAGYYDHCDLWQPTPPYNQITSHEERKFKESLRQLMANHECLMQVVLSLVANKRDVPLLDHRMLRLHKKLIWRQIWDGDQPSTPGICCRNDCDCETESWSYSESDSDHNESDADHNESDSD